MKWTYFPKVPGSAALWQLDEDDQEPTRGLSGKLFILDFRGCSWGEQHAWIVTRRSAKPLGTLPYDTPEEELKALAIAMWRLG
jgi:hypothetical protein